MAPHGRMALLTLSLLELLIAAKKWRTGDIDTMELADSPQHSSESQPTFLVQDETSRPNIRKANHIVNTDNRDKDFPIKGFPTPHPTPPPLKSV